MPSKNIVDFANQVKSYAFGIKDQQVLGAWNLWDDTIAIKSNQGGTSTKTSDGYDIQCTTNNTSGCYFDKNDVIDKYTQYGRIKVSFEYKSDIACSGSIGIYPDRYEGILPTSWTKYNLIVDVADVNNIVFYNADTSQTPKISMRNMMISMPTDTDLPYVAPSMTNRELTEVKDITSSITQPTQTHYSINASNLHVLKLGKLVIADFEVESLDIDVPPAGQSWTTVFSSMPSGYNDKVISVKSSSNSANMAQVYLWTNGNIGVRGGTTGEKYNFSLIYFCK